MMRLLYVCNVGATRFELAASSSQNWHSTGLSYTPNLVQSTLLTFVLG